MKITQSKNAEFKNNHSKRNLDNLVNDTGRNSADIDKQQNIIVYYTPSGANSAAEAVPHSLSWSKESRLTASCYPDILPTDRNGHSQVLFLPDLIIELII